MVKIADPEKPKSLFEHNYIQLKRVRIFSFLPKPIKSKTLQTMANDELTSIKQTGYSLMTIQQSILFEIMHNSFIDL